MKNEIHKIHNYIREYTKISNEDRAFFIAIILISIKKSSFKIIFEKFSNKEYIYDIILDNLTDFNIDIEVFKFLRNDENNTHFYNLIHMIFNIYEKNPDIDLLNEFYSEFVKYNNSDGKKLGIVLTPPHIIKLMTEILNITSDDIVLDLCTGTGSYLIEAHKYNPKQLIGCEFQNKLFALFKCNIILRNINNIISIKGNCFNHTFNATKSLINPPYNIKSEPEFKFIIKQLDSLTEGGLATAIIPIDILSNNKKNNKFKMKLLAIANIKAIIICRKELFYPYASVKCAILLLQKNKNGNEIYTKIINYEDDGFELVKHSGNIQTERFETNYLKVLDDLNVGFEKLLTIDSDWQELHSNKLNSISTQQLLLSKLELEYIDNKMKILELSNSNISYNLTNEILLCDIFEIISGKNILLKNYKNSFTGFNIISSSDKNNAIHINKCDFYTFEGDCLTLNKNGSVGYCFYQTNKFAKTCDVIVLKSKIPISKFIYIYFANLITNTCHNLKFDWGFKINLTRLKKIKLNIPVDSNNNIDYAFIENLFN